MNLNWLHLASLINDAKKVVATLKGQIKGIDGDLGNAISQAVGELEGLLGKDLNNANLEKGIAIAHEVAELLEHRKDILNTAHEVEIIIRKEGQEAKRLNLKNLVPAFRAICQAGVDLADEIQHPASPQT